jgi:hypothetical protein
MLRSQAGISDGSRAKKVEAAARFERLTFALLRA